MTEAKTDVSQLPINQVLCGDCVEVMKTLPNESIDMTMFSPPYWGLRDYGGSTQTIWNAKADCEHEWSELPMSLVHENRNFSVGTQEEVHQEKPTTYIKKYDSKIANYCVKCGAWKGQLGLEPSPQLYISHMTMLCGEVKRILKNTGSMYIVIGDTYASMKGKCYNAGGGEESLQQVAFKELTRDKNPNRMLHNDGAWLQPKQLMGIPWRVAITLQEDGWILRNCIIWHKPNCMPSSVKDRLTNSYEHIFHFVKSRKYYYDLDAIREKPISVKPSGNRQRKPSLQPRNSHVGRSIPWDPMGKAKQYRRRDSTFQIVPTESPHRTSKDVIGRYEGKFEGFGEESDKYGSPRARTQRHKCTTEGTMLPNGARIRHGLNHSTLGSEHILGKNPSDVIKIWDKVKPNEKGILGGAYGWEPDPHRKERVSEIEQNPLGKNPSDFWNITTKPFKGAHSHFAVYPEQLCIRPIKSSCPPNGIVLDLMCGSGTTLAVAKKLGRKFIGIELNPQYIEIAIKRLSAIPEKITTFF